MSNDRQITIALDVMGADAGEAQIIEGGIEAARHYGGKLNVVLVGCKPELDQTLSQSDTLPGNVSVEYSETSVPMHASATDGLRRRSSSIAVALKLVREGRADGFVSPGNTGAVMATALLTLGRIEGVSRPAITTVIPTANLRPTLLLDVGANVDCKPHHLEQFAVMGSVYSSIMFNNEAPRVGLLSIGEERSKGNELVFCAGEELRKSRVNFVGNVEGRDILSGTVDVVVTDGFTGNILLKFAESFKPLMGRAIQRQIQTNMFSRVGAMLLLPFLRRMRDQFDYSRYGGVPLLGVNGIVIICHGLSNSIAIRNAVGVGMELCSRKIIERIYDELTTNHFGHNNGTKAKSQDHRDGVVCPATANDQR
ncbi:MAG: phosphate acyltransferase PlsX [Candidatus Zixiibacteriota bacterium]